MLIELITLVWEQAKEKDSRRIFLYYFLPYIVNGQVSILELENLIYTVKESQGEERESNGNRKK